MIAGTAIGQGKVKVIEKKFDNGKPEIVKYFIGQKQDKYLSSREVYSMDGKKILVEAYANGVLHGKVQAWKEFSGETELELNYVAGKLDGQQTYFFSDGRPKRVMNFKSGRMDGRQIEYWFKKSSDTLKIEHNFSGGIFHGMQRQWNKDGTLKYNYNFVAGKPDGIQRMWKDGEKIEESWKTGRKNEVLETWTAAQPKHIKMFTYEMAGDSMNLKLGKKFEKEIVYYESGSIHAVTEGAEEPQTTEYHPNGKDRAKGAGTLAKPIGEWTYWHLNGAKMMEGKYVDFKRSGPWRVWDEQGNVVSEEVWNKESGKREVWKVSLYHSNGQKESEGSLNEDGVKKGMWKYWYANGNKKREENWITACKAGNSRYSLTELKSWDETEKLIVKGNETDQEEFEYYPDGNTRAVHQVQYLNREPCSAGPQEKFVDGRMETKNKPANFDKKVIRETVTFTESGDSLRIDRFDAKGKRDGYQDGWYESGKKRYSYHYLEGRAQGTVKEWYEAGTPMLDHKYKSAMGGPPKLVEGTYYSDKGKDYFFSDSSGKNKKKVMEEIDAMCYFLKFVEEVKD